MHLAAVAPVEEITRAADVSPEEPLSDREVERFLSDGYVVLPSLLGDGPGSMNDALRQDLDRLCDAREAHQQDKSAALPHVVEFGTLGELVTHPPVVDKLTQLMSAYGNGRTDFALHHIHAARHTSGTGPSHWHQVSGGRVSGKPSLWLPSKLLFPRRITSSSPKSTGKTSWCTSSST